MTNGINDGIEISLVNTGLLQDNSITFTVGDMGTSTYNAQLMEYNLDDTVMLTSAVIDRPKDYTLSFKPNGSGVMKLVITSLTNASDVIGISNLYTTVITYTSQNITSTICNSGGDKYRFGFNGQEKDNEIKGVGNSLDFGARMYDSRLGRWLSLDPLATKYPHVSPYAFVGNSPIVLVDPNGKEWVNYHTIEIARLQSELLKTPNNKDLLRELSDQQYYQQKVNDALTNYKEYAEDLYNYIDGLQVQFKHRDKMTNVKVIVRFDRNYSDPDSRADGVTVTLPLSNEDFRSKDAIYNGKEINSPLNPYPRDDHNERIGFAVILYNSNDLDGALSNEVGDVKYYMEENDKLEEDYSEKRDYWNPKGGKGPDAYSRREEINYKATRKEKQAAKKLDKQIEKDVKDGLKHEGTKEVDPNKTGQRLGDK